MQIYFAAPLFCQAEKEFNLQLTHILEKHGFTVFLPQRDGMESSKPPYNEMTGDELFKAIFALDRDKIQEADIFLFVLDGRVPDEGACVELGIAYSQKHYINQDKLLIGLHTDARGAFTNTGAKLNAMISGSLDIVANNENDLITTLKEYQHKMTA
jgi:nucleoside 2-deoxyribosyltransferase